MEQFIQLERDLSEQVTQISTLGEYFTWVQRCNECIEQLEEHSRVKRARVVTGNGQALVARIARLEGLKTQLERRFIHFGGGKCISGDDNANGLFWRQIDTAFKNRIVTGAVINTNYIEPQRFLEDAACIVLEQVQKVIERYNSVKVNTLFNGEFVTGDKRTNKSINTKNCELFQTSDLQEWYERHVSEPTLTVLEEFQERDSGWALSRILDLTININKFNSMHAGCYKNLPQEISAKKAVVNVKSADNACFAWSVVAALYPAKRNADRDSSYPHYTTVLNVQSIEFPMTLNQITKFERLNEISINVYSIDSSEEQKKKKTLNIFPIHLTCNKREKHVNLLYISDSEDEAHFAWIKNLSRLVSSQVSKHHGRKYICDRCVPMIIINILFSSQKD